MLKSSVRQDARLYLARREKFVSGLAAFATVLLIAVMLVFGLRVVYLAPISETLVSIGFLPEKPPDRKPQVQVRPSPTRVARHEASPPNLRNKATPIVALPVTPLIVPPPVVTATQAGIGQAASAGAADTPGPGQGAGGVGNGGGGDGDGGDGDGGGAVVGPRRTKGRLSFGDLPEELLPAGSTGKVEVVYRVNIDGRVSNCRAERSSGIPALDQLTCRLIEQRFRFRPARDRRGRSVPSMIIESHSWIIPPEPVRRSQ